MATVLTNTINRRIKQACVLIVAVILCRWILVPLSLVFSGELFRLLAPRKYDTSFMVFETITDGIAFGFSGFVTGVLVSTFSANREMETTVFTALVMTVWFVIELGSIPFRLGLTGSELAYRLLTVAVCATCLSTFAIIGARLIRTRHLRLRRR